MPHRRYGRRLIFSRLDPDTRQLLLRLTRAPKYLRVRAARVWKPAAVDALLDPRRLAPRSKPPRVAP